MMKKQGKSRIVLAMSLSLMAISLPVTVAAGEASGYVQNNLTDSVQAESTEGQITKEGTTQDGYSYRISDNSITITGYSGNASVLEIPAAISGYPVKTIGMWAFEGRDNLTSVTIPEGVASVKWCAFASCDNLQKVIIPGSLRVIEQDVFSYCPNLTDVTISNGVKVIEGQAFASCTSLEKIYIPDSVTTLGVTGDLSGPFDRCFGLKEISLPCSLESDIAWLYSSYPENQGTATVTVRHSFPSWITTSEATIFQAEQQERTCKLCGKTETRTGEKLKGTILLTARSLKMKTGQSTTEFRAYGFSNGDSLKSAVSSAPSIVKVSDVKKDGTLKLTAKNKTGTAVLTFTTESGASIKTKVVVRKGIVKTSSVTGIPKTLTLKKGTSKKLKPVLLPVTSQEEISYMSSNKSVATVSSSGKIKARKKGTAVITVKSGTKTAKCKVIIK